jgi:hypothetical protein
MGHSYTVPRSGFRPCYQFVSWWDGEYEGNCELRADHPPGIHCDGMSWFDDDNEPITLADDVERYIESIYGPPSGLEVV